MPGMSLLFRSRPIEDLHKHYGALEVLKGIDIDVAAGEKVSIIGPSGSGKTTLLRCINYIEKPTGGHIYIGGQLIGEKRKDRSYSELDDRSLARQRSQIGMVFQRFNLFPHLTVMQNYVQLARSNVLNKSATNAPEIALNNY